MNKSQNYQVVLNKQIATDIFEMKLKGDTSWLNKAGKFINITIDNLYLKRPISICDYDEESLTIIYKIVGKGTKKLASYPLHSNLNALINLGNGFNLIDNRKTFMLVGGGVGIPPLYNLAKKLKSKNKKVIAVLGYQSKDSVFYENEFKEIVDELYITTNDGSYGYKGFVTDIIQRRQIENIYYYTCGPKTMLKAVYELCDSGQLSFEAGIGCGFGACMGCSMKMKNGTYKRICKEGPIFESEELIWED